MDMKNGAYKISIEHRVTNLENAVIDLGKKIDELKNNHIAHIQNAIDNIQSKMVYGLWFIVVTLVGLVVDLITRFASIK